jgi:hypothetical protein
MRNTLNILNIHQMITECHAFEGMMLTAIRTFWAFASHDCMLLLCQEDGFLWS